MFKTAIWYFQFEPVGERTEITCGVSVSVRFLYMFLYPVLYFTKSALLRDLNFLKVALDEEYGSVSKLKIL
jgi:hypothetical protein